jgi:hypothetical protein
MLRRRRNARRSFECEPVSNADARRHVDGNADALANP